MLCLRLARCAALLLACFLESVGAGEAAGLFSADNGFAEPSRISSRNLLGEAADHADAVREGVSALGGADPSEIVRSRVAALDFGQLDEARSAAAVGRAVRLNLNLFVDAQFEAVFERSAPTAFGYALTGRIEGEPLSTVVLAVHGE